MKTHATMPVGNPRKGVSEISQRPRTVGRDDSLGEGGRRSYIADVNARRPAQ